MSPASQAPPLGPRIILLFQEPGSGAPSSSLLLEPAPLTWR